MIPSIPALSQNKSEIMLLDMSPPDASFIPLDASLRASAPGFFVDLPDGGVHCRWDGPGHGPVVVMVHGFSLHHVAFDHLVPALTAAGYRVLRMDNYGRGWSDRPRAHHDVDLFDRQLGGVFDALGLQEPVTLAGYSMGGAIAIAFAARHPQRVARLALMAPAGLPFATPAIGRILRVPILGEALLHLSGRRTTLKGMAQLLAADPALAQEYVAKIDAVIGFPGYFAALLSTLRYYPLSGLLQQWRAVGAQRTPTLLLWGEQDRTVLFPGAEYLKSVMPAARLQTFAREDHGIPMTVADELSQWMLQFLSETS